MRRESLSTLARQLENFIVRKNHRFAVLEELLDGRASPQIVIVLLELEDLIYDCILQHP